MKEIATAEWNANPFTMIGKDDVLVAAERNGKVNAMTAGWGGLGVMWGKDVVFIVIRPSRYTKEFVDAGERFSVVHMGSDSKKLMTYMGTVSGRDEDKIAHEGLTLIPGEASPCFYEANVNICLLYTSITEITATAARRGSADMLTQRANRLLWYT